MVQAKITHMTQKQTTSQQYYERHIFFCLNDRDKSKGEDACAHHNANDSFTHCKQAVKKAGLAGEGKVRVNKAGCLDRCAGGPIAVVYPEGVWYSYVDTHDIDEIVESHLKHGKVVERLVTPAGVGR
jgi:(2Fe-2S) ferredoxin